MCSAAPSLTGFTCNPTGLADIIDIQVRSSLSLSLTLLLSASLHPLLLCRLSVSLSLFLPPGSSDLTVSLLIYSLLVSFCLFTVLGV
jgi:hypothetical protein